MTFGSAPGPLRSPPLSSAGTCFFFRARPRLSPLSRPWDGTSCFPAPSGRRLLHHMRSVYFLRFLLAHDLWIHPHAHAAPPPRARSFVASGLRPGHTLCPPPPRITSLFPRHILAIPPGVLRSGTSPPPLLTYRMHTAICPSGLRPV